jgi:hypothetical protein
MNSTRDPREVEAVLQQWEAIDREHGARAAARRAAVLAAQGDDIVRDYEFHAKPNDWVHLDSMRPVRFFYRNLPFGLRMALKKRLAR